MKTFTKLLAGLALVSATTYASAIQFNVAASLFTPGSGYSATTNAFGEALNLDKLGVDFTVDSTGRSFGLATGATSASFKFGDIKLKERSIHTSLAPSAPSACVPIWLTRPMIWASQPPSRSPTR